VTIGCSASRAVSSRWCPPSSGAEAVPSRDPMRQAICRAAGAAAPSIPESLLIRNLDHSENNAG
jgi:hypothetical protein